MKKQKDFEENLLRREKYLIIKECHKYEQKIYLYLMFFVVSMLIIYIYFENSKNTVEIQVPTSKIQPVTKEAAAFVEFDISDKTNSFVKNMKFIKEYNLMWNKENEKNMGNLVPANHINSCSNFLKKLIKISLNMEKLSTEKADERKQLQELQDSKSILDFDFATASSPKNFVEHRSDANPSSSSQKPEEISPVFSHRTVSDKKLNSYEKHTIDDLLKDYEDSDNNFNDHDDNFVSYFYDKYGKFSSKHFNQTFFEQLISPEKHAVENSLKDGVDQHHNEYKDYKNNYASDTYTSE